MCKLYKYILIAPSELEGNSQFIISVGRPKGKRKLERP
jgi:hypothetical protein